MTRCVRLAAAHDRAKLALVALSLGVASAGVFHFAAISRAMQAHLTPSPGVWKQLNSARAPTLIASDAIAPPSNNAILTYELSDIVAEDHA